MADVDLADVSMDLDSQEEREVHECDVCHVSYTTDVELRDHHWSLMHHIKMEKQKKGSVHNCTLCFMTCANIIEYGKHLNEEKHKRAVEDCRRQREEEDLLMGKDVLMARIKEKEEQEKSKQRNRQKCNQAKKKGSNNLSDPESSRNNAVGKRRSERTSQRKWGSGSGHQRSFSLPGQNVGQRSRNPHWERQSYNDDFQLDSMANNFQDPSWTQWNGNYGNMQHEQWNMNMEFQQNFHEFPNQNYQQRCYDNGQYNMQGHLEDNGWEIDRRGMRGNVGPGNKKNRYSAYHNDHNFDPNFPYELMNASGFPEESWGWGEDSYGFQDEYSLRDRSRWDRRNPQRNNLRKDSFRDRSNRNQGSKASHNEREQKITQDNKNKEKPLEKLEHIHTDIAFRTTGEVSQSNNRSGSPSSERYLDSMRENRNRSDSYEKGTNKRRRFNSPANSTERRSRQDKGKEPKNTHIKFDDDEDKSSQHEGDSVTSSGDKEELSSGSSGKKGEKKEKKKSILKKKKKNGSKGSPPGSPKRSNKKVREEKGGEGVLEKAEKLCRELREKREKAKLEREKKMKMEQMEKLENINQELKTLSDKSKEYVKGHIPTEEIRQTTTVDSSAKERTEKETKNGNISKLGQCNKDIDKIRQNIEKSVQNINETQKLLNSAGTESKSEKKETSSRINKSRLESLPFPEESVGHSSKKDKSEKKETSSRINKSQLESFVSEASVGHSNKKEAYAKPDSQKTSKTLDKTSSSGKSKEKLTTDSLLKMVNSPRSRKERQQLAGMLRSYAQSQKKLSLPRYNLQLSGSYDDNFDNKIEELRLEELSREVQIQIAQLMEADVTPDLNDLEMALMSSTAKKSVDTSDTLETDTSSRPGSFYVSALDQFQELDRALQGSSKERPRTLSTDLDKQQSKNRKDMDSSAAQPLKMSDLSSNSAVIVKSEPMDTGHEKAAQGSTSPDSATNLVTSTTSLGETGKTLPTPTAVPSPRMPQSTDQFPQRSSTQMDASLPTLSGSLSSLESGRSTESIFDTVYDISIKEESLRKDLNEVEQFITYFRNVIDEATVQLNRYNEKKLRLQSEEEKLRGKRLRILHEVKIQQRSGRSTPQLSELEDQIRGPALEDGGKAMTPGQTSHNPDPQSLSNIPAALRAEGLDSEEAGLVETGSEDTEQSVRVKQEVISGRSLLEDVQLETESEDNRQLAAEARERLSLDKEVMENFRKAVENMKSTLGLSTLQIPEDHLPSPHRDPIQYMGPKEVISGIEVLDGFLYVSYQGKIIKRFNLQTGELDFDFNTMSYNVSCILVCQETNKLYVGAQEMMLLTYCCKTKKPLKVEPTEGKPQCFLESWGHLYIGTDCGTVVVLSLKNDKVLDTFHCADRSISRICSATEGVRKVILVASFDAMIYVYDSSTGLLIRMLEGHTKTPFTLQVDGHLVYSGSGDKTVMEHDISTGELLWTFTEAAGIVSCVCTHGDQLFCASYDRLIRCYSKKSRKLLRLYYGAGAGEGLIIRMRISDGMLITGNRQGLTEAVPITQQDHSCQCSDCSFVFALRSHLVYHVVHDHILNNVRAGKKTPCPWRNCKERFQSTAPKDVIEEHIIVHAYS